MLKRTLTLSVLVALLASGCSDDKGKEQPGAKKTAQKISKAFAARDANGDGAISRKEFVLFAKSRADERFSKIDGNKDSSINLVEFTATKAKMQKNLKAKGMAQEQINERIKKLFSGIDKDGDGKITSEEYLKMAATAAGSQFKEKDADGNKKLSPKEFSAKPTAKKATTAPDEDEEDAGMENTTTE